MNPEQVEENSINKLVSNARAIIANEVALPQGCIRMERVLMALHASPDISYPLFRDYLQEVRKQGPLPIGQERLQWDRDKLAELDLRLRALNSRYEAKIIETCWTILDRHGNN